MATKNETIDPEIISPKEKMKGRRIVEDLRNEALLSVDSEGIQLGKDGPLTLLQVGTLDGRVYLFDVMLNELTQDKSFFKEIGLDSILTSNKIIKVIHSCSGDSAALYYQFGIHLKNVFDTQVAHLVIEEHKGQKLPSRLKLADMCERYSKNADVYEGKESLKMEWNKLVGNFWAIRPMTDEMIKYASCDVTALIPEVYEAQKKYITDNRLDETYECRVREEIDLDIDPAQKDRRIKRNQDIRAAILTEMDKDCPNSLTFETITDPDQIKSIEDRKLSEMEHLSDKMKRLKREYWVKFMEGLEQELLSPESYEPHRSVWYRLGEIERDGIEASKTLAKSVKKQLAEMVLKDIDRKYTANTSLECLKSVEHSVLKTVRPTDGGESMTDTIVGLHWKIEEKEIDEETKKLTEDNNYESHISSGKLGFLINNKKVPQSLKDKAKDLKDISIKRVLLSIPKKYKSSTKIEDLSYNERAVLRTLQVARNTYHPTVVELHWKQTYADLCEKLTKIREGNFRVEEGFRRHLDFLSRNRQVPSFVKTEAKHIMAAIRK